jgi:hypothetical protein
MNKVPNRLNHYASNVVSQTGEDGILQKIFEVLPSLNRWCVEFGAWDGKLFSNTWNLLNNHSWKGVLIEADSGKFKDLQNTYSENQNVITLNKFVNFEGENCLDVLLANTGIPVDFDLLSIDIDGNDYHIWNSLRNYQPKVVVIEMNPSIPNDIEFVQKKDMRVNQGSSMRSLVRLGKEKGYELICCTELNGIFVKNEFYSLFGITDNSIETLNPLPPAPRIFQLYDGTLMLTQEFKLRWAELKVTNNDIQIIPRMFRFYDSSNVSFLKKRLKSFFMNMKKNV